MAVVVASIPAGHVYVRHLGAPGGSDAVVRLPDRPVTGGSPDARWWPPAMLDAGWVRAHADEFDIMHVHFGFDHMALEVATVSELFKIRDFLKSKGVTIFYEGRRGPGGNPGLEFYDPDGYKIEIYASMDQIGTDGRSRPAKSGSTAAGLWTLSEQLTGVQFQI